MTLEAGVKALAEAVAVDVKALEDSKVDKVSDKGLSDENYTLAEKNKLSGVAVEATKNRADSENADKVHPHTMAQVTGLEAALTGKAATTDPRFTDAREWTATTTSQSEAETGTATTRRAFTAQRVRQSGVATVKSMTVQVTGTSTTNVMSQKAVTDAINNSSIGVGQTWQNMTENRVIDTVYTNTTGQPIEVSISSYCIQGYAGCKLFVDDVLVGQYFADAPQGSHFSAVVPAGSHYYVFPNPEGSIGLDVWSELRN